MKKLFDHKLLLVFVLVLLFFLTRLPGLGPDVINPDGVNWHFRSQQFVVALKRGDFIKTYQHYHPGVTLMWVTGVSIELYKQISHIQFYDISNFLQFELVAKLSLVLFQAVLLVITFIYLTKILNRPTAFAVLSLYILEPFVLGNSRLYHMDTLLTQFLFLGLIIAYRNLTNFSIRNTVFASLFLALAFLTKSIGISGFLFVTLTYVAVFVQQKNYRKAFKYAGISVAAFILFSFLFFPALWVQPVSVLSSLFSESVRIGVRNGHDQIILGEETMNAGFGFYPLVLVLKSSPALVLGLLLFVLSLKKRPTAFTIYLSAFYLAYLLFMSFPAKKLDRYLLPLYPYLAYLAVLGYSALLGFVEKRWQVKKASYYLVALLILAYAWPLTTYYPYYFTYTSPLFGSPANANKILAQKPFGVGIVELKNLILQKYPSEPRLGFIDVKPMETIYPNSKVFDMRVSGPGKYDLMVLGINEQIPEKVEDNGVVFEKSASLYINGLEYWRIYAKK